MNKVIANQFLQDLTEPDENEQHAPRVIVVRSNRNQKRFITSALSEVEDLVELVKSEALNWSKIHHRLTQLAQLADDHQQHNIDIAATDIARLTQTLSDDSLTDEGIKKTYGDFVTYLSTMLLRVYIEGSDEKCIWELASVELLVAECQRRASMQAAERRHRAHWVN